MTTPLPPALNKADIQGMSPRVFDAFIHLVERNKGMRFSLRLYAFILVSQGLLIAALLWAKSC